MRARAHAAEAGGAAARTQAPGPPRAASRRRCRPCAFAAVGRAPTPARRPPRPSFYRVVSRAADSATRRGGPERGRGPQGCRLWLLPRRRLAPHCWRRPAGASRRARPGRGDRVCAAGRAGRRRAPAPCRGPRRKPGEARAARRPLPGRAARAPISLFAPFCLLAAYGRLMEGRVHRPLYPARRASQALLACAAGFGVALSSSSSPHTGWRRPRCGRVCNKSFDFWTHGSWLKVGALAAPWWSRACGPAVRGLFGEKIPGKRGGLGQKEDLEAGGLDGTTTKKRW